MDARELKINNLVDYFGKVKTVIKISKENSQWYVGCSNGVNEIIDCWNVEDAYDPILLTEEWLLKFFFEQRSNIWHKQVHEGYVSLMIFKEEFKDKIRFVTTLNIDGNRMPINIKHVHQLQNLYFALTGEELTIKS